MYRFSKRENAEMILVGFTVLPCPSSTRQVELWVFFRFLTLRKHRSRTAPWFLRSDHGMAKTLHGLGRVDCKHPNAATNLAIKHKAMYVGPSYIKCILCEVVLLCLADGGSLCFQWAGDWLVKH